MINHIVFRTTIFNKTRFFYLYAIKIKIGGAAMVKQKTSILWGWLNENEEERLRNNNTIYEQKIFFKEISDLLSSLKDIKVNHRKINEHFYILEPFRMIHQEKYGFLELASYYNNSMWLVKEAHVPTTKHFADDYDPRHAEYLNKRLKVRSDLVKTLESKGFNIHYYTEISEI